MHASCSPWQMERFGILLSFLPIALAFGSMFGTKKTCQIRFGRFERTALIFIPCCRAGGNPPSECCGVWSSDGRYFLFLNDNPVLGGGNIWALQESNSAFRKYPSRLFQLTAGPMLFGAMTWSPDGKKLFAEGFQNRGELIRYDAQRREFVPFLSGIWASDVSFSRDGKWVAYVSYPEGTLWRSRVDGSDRLQLTNPPVFAVYATLVA